MGISAAEIFGVATFYSMFRLKPQGKYVVRVCKGTACHVSGANAILNAIKEHLKLEDEEDTTSDAQFTVMEVACLGCCSLAPVIMIGDQTYGKLTPESVPAVIAKFAK
jgi:NADH:ubiquinone oxidoreductase subunit E